MYDPATLKATSRVRSRSYLAATGASFPEGRLYRRLARHVALRQAGRTSPTIESQSLSRTEPASFVEKLSKMPDGDGGADHVLIYKGSNMGSSSSCARKVPVFRRRHRRHVQKNRHLVLRQHAADVEYAAPSSSMRDQMDKIGTSAGRCSLGWRDCGVMGDGLDWGGRDSATVPVTQLTGRRRGHRLSTAGPGAAVIFKYFELPRHRRLHLQRARSRQVNPITSKHLGMELPLPAQDRAMFMDWLSAFRADRKPFPHVNGA